MKDWNVVITVHEGHFKEAFHVLNDFGNVSKTDFFNVLVMKSDDLPALIKGLQQRIAEKPAFLYAVAGLMPASRTFNFQSPEEFEKKAGETVKEWIPALSGKGFHVRIHRRGFKGKLSSLKEEQFLDKCLTDVLDKTSLPGHITFRDPDFIIAIETVGGRAGLSLWSRDDLEAYTFLKVD